ncbi:MAG: translation initiation factor IF-2 [Brevinematales bacterium]
MSEDQKKIIKKKIKLKVTKTKTGEEKELEVTAKAEEKKVETKEVKVVKKQEKKEEPKVSKEDHLKRMNEKVKKELESKKSGQEKPQEFRRFKRFDSKDKGEKPQFKSKGFEKKDFGQKKVIIEAPVDKSQQWREKQQKNVSLEKSQTLISIKEKYKNKEEEILLSKMEDTIKKKQKKGEAAVPESIEIQEVLTVGELAKKMNLKASEVIQKLLELGITATINDTIDSDAATLVASEYNCKVIVKSLKDEVEIKEEPDNPEDLKPRSPVVTIMGHVDHGKTKLLDAIRNSSIAEHETGGITQHIGAYRVKTKNGEITFIDTPGHEAFTSLRARGANVTDIVILVVSAVEGVMPQTIEALNHAKAANVPIIVAVNKIDLPDASPDRCKQQLAEHGLLCEEWGGDTMFVNVSALKKQGINELLEAVLLQAELMELKANPDKKGWGYVIEAKMDVGRGPVATIIVKNGSIKVGDYFVVGTTMGKVRGMFDEYGGKINKALPSYPVEIMGFEVVPTAGEKFHVVENEDIAKNIAQKRLELKKIEEIKQIKKAQLENAEFAMSGEKIEEIKLIIKGDVQGSIEAIKTSLEKLNKENIKITILHSAVGAVLESDVMLASANANVSKSRAMILAFRVRVDSIAKEKAEAEGVEIKRFNIIYELIDYVESIIKGMQKVEYVEQVIGTAEIKEIFKIKDVGKVAGCIVTRGYIRKSDNVRIFREGLQVWDGKILSLKRFTEDTNEVQEGFDCGISFVNYENFKKGDIIECYTKQEKK